MEKFSAQEDSDFEDSAQVNNTISKVNWIFKREVMQGVKFKVNFKMKEGIIQTIMVGLNRQSSNAFKKFKRTCFGHLCKLPAVVNKCATAVHYFISREMEFTDGSDDPTEMSFFVKGKRVRFRRYEYALVTGLRFGGSQFNLHGNLVIPDDSLYSRKFNNNPITVDNLEKMFVAHELGDETEDYLKVSKILFVYNILLGLETKTKIVADWMWVLVENNDEWESFPWGSYSYQHLLQYIKGIKSILANNGKSESYPIYGFSAAFLAWIYCVVPQLGSACGGLLSDKKTPRILRFHYNRTNAKVTEVTGEVYETLKPSLEETETEYWKSIEPRHTPFLLNYKRKKTRSTNLVQTISTSFHEPTPEARADENIVVGTKKGAEQAKHQDNIEEQHHASPPRGNSEIRLTFDQQQAWTGQISENVHKRIRSDEQLIHMIGESTFSFIRKDNSFIEEIGGCVAKRVRSELSDFIPGYLEYITHCQSINGEHIKSAKDPLFTTPMQDKELQHDEIPDNDPIWSQSDAVARDVISSGKKNISPNVQQPQFDKAGNTYPKKLDFKAVRARAASAVLKSPFCTYDKRGVEYNKFLRSKAKRNVGIDYAVSSSFFKDIANVKKELSKTHIDAYLACLHTSPEFGGLRKYNKRVTITSTALVPAVNQVFYKHHNDEDSPQFDPVVEETLRDEDLYNLSQFAIGALPKWGPIKPWHDYDKVIVVVHNIYHWMTCCLDLKESCIKIYDPQQHLYDATDNEDNIQFVVPLARVLPQVLRYAGFYDARQDITPCLTQWKVEHPETGNLYKENDSVNCGAYALKYVEAILTGDFEEGFGKKDLKNYRNQLAMSVYSFSSDEGTLAS